MAEETITVTSRMVAKPGAVDTLRKVVAEFLAMTRKEPGCISDDWFQNSENPQEAVFFERWRGWEGIQAHMATQHFQAFMAKAPELLLPPVAGNEGVFEVLICTPYAG